MQLHNLNHRSLGGYTTFGSVWKQDEVRTKNFKLHTESGVTVPVQTRITAWWPDGSVKWAAHTADSAQMGQVVTILPDTGEVPVSGDMQITIQEVDGSFCVDTGRIQLTLPNAGGLPASYLVKDIIHSGGRQIDRAYPVLQLERPIGSGEKRLVSFRGQIQEVLVEEKGPLQCVICFRGSHVQDETGEVIIPFVIRMYLGAGSDELRFVHTFFYDGKLCV